MKSNQNVRSIKLFAVLIALFALVINFSTAGAHLKSDKFPAKSERSKLKNKATKIATTTYTFNVSSDHSGYTYFNVSVNGESISGTEAITTGSPVTVYDTYSVSNGSTVVVQITGGYMPTSSVLEGPFPAISGEISGSTITFTNVPLNNGYSECGLLLN